MSLIKLVVISFKSLFVKFHVKRMNIHKISPNFDEAILLFYIESDNNLNDKYFLLS